MYIHLTYFRLRLIVKFCGLFFVLKFVITLIFLFLSCFLNHILKYYFQMTSSLKTNEDPVSERKKLYMSERQIPALFEVKIYQLNILIRKIF
jgi:hypothetical protein